MMQTPIIFDSVFENLKIHISENHYASIYILVDRNTHEFCLPKFLAELELTVPIEIIEIPEGEESKSIEIVIQVWRTLADFNASRKSLMINLGGGVVTDIGGFIASTYKRGISFINVPTSLLAMVDASVGGKTGIDLNGFKNIVGTFAFPKLTVIYPEFLETLPERELNSGVAEMLKHGLIYDENHWNNLIKIQPITPESIYPYIKDSIEIKRKIVEKDPYETGIRKILNFGHTVGHALESELLHSEFPLLHGEAVKIGMMVETMLSYENELISKEDLELIFHQMNRGNLTPQIPDDLIPFLIERMKNDKKNLTDKFNFSLIHSIGNCKYDVFLNENQITDGIRKYNKKVSK